MIWNESYDRALVQSVINLTYAGFHKTESAEYAKRPKWIKASLFWHSVACGVIALLPQREEYPTPGACSKRWHDYVFNKYTNGKLS